MIGLRIIPEGERVLCRDRAGRARPVDGPRRLWLWGERLETLERVAAGPEEYLVVVARDGTTTHERGPCARWLNPVEHVALRAAPLLKLDANEAIVVYRPEAEQVRRRIERGPALFMPAPDEWLHQFSWHGADPRDHRRKQPSALRFEKLRVIPDQMYYDVEAVRTADDALITVRLMVFFELTDIGRMLDQTHDPIGDFINAATADVIDFAATEPFEQFKEKTERLNELGTYPQLMRRAETIGYRVTKVVYRGYQAGAALQTMHDEAIEARTRLKLEAETQGQAQDLADLRQAREATREAARQATEAARMAHENRLRELENENRLLLVRAEREQALELEARTQAQDREHRQLADRQRLTFLEGMATLKVDMTRYLVAQYQHPDKLIRITAGEDAAPQMHVHTEEA